MSFARALMRWSLPPSIRREHEKQTRRDTNRAAEAVMPDAEVEQPAQAINENVRANTKVVRRSSKKSSRPALAGGRQEPAGGGEGAKGSSRRFPSKLGREMVKVFVGPTQDEANSFLVDKHALLSCSPYFSDALGNSTAQPSSSASAQTIHIPTTTAETFPLFLSWLYNGGRLPTTSFAESLALFALGCTINNTSLRRASWKAMQRTKKQFLDHQDAYKLWDSVRGSVARFYICLRYSELLVRVAAAKKPGQQLERPNQEGADLAAFLWDVTLAAAVCDASADRRRLVGELEVFMAAFRGYA